jgi:hypothetical protein
MRKGLSLLVVAVAIILSGQQVESQEVSSLGGYACRAFLRIAYSHLERFAGILVPSKFRFRADGGDDGGGGDGGGRSGGDGGGTGGGAGGSSDGDGNGASDATAGDTSAATADDADAAAPASVAAGWLLHTEGQLKERSSERSPKRGVNTATTSESLRRVT